ncbi:BamA/TamA family outer membrane protein [Rheinheimera sp. NSM]|uniref:BamA/TamA family outer membrane protein n=1 Tax=Rheinheimera sp. NSM TaxID=3457884 RepID=UPI00403505E3
MLRSLSCLFTLLFSCAAQAVCTDISPQQQADLPGDVTIGSISYRRNNVFDLTEKGTFWLHRFANYSHIITKEPTVQDDLLFLQGAALNLQELEETERLLRNRAYIRDAAVSVSQYCPQSNSVNVLVETWDNWSLLPKIDFSSEGGETDYSIGIADDNLLGSGNQLQLDYAKDSERSGYLLSFASPNIFGTHWNALTRYADNSDGESYHFTLTRPFYRLSSPWAFSLDMEKNKEEISDYLLGDEVNQYDRKLHWFETYVGFKIAQQANHIHRLNIGFTLNDTNFQQSELTAYDLPPDRNLSAVWLEYQLLVSDYRKLFNINQFNRVEDINLGWQARLRLGRLQSWLGADDAGWQLDTELAKVWQLNNSTFLLGNSRYQALWLSGINQHLFSNQLQLVYQLNNNSSAVGIVNAEFGRQLFQDKALYLGGDTGLRAFPLYYQRGDSRIVATAEYRYFTDWSILQLLDVGFAGFADAGRSWGAEQGFNSNIDDGVLFGVGGGVRLLSSHSSRGTMIHIDLTHPFSSNPELDKWQWRITAKKRF